MIPVIKPFTSLYSSVFFLLTALGLLNTFLSLRLSMAGVSVQATGLVLTAYYVGLTLGTFICGSIIRQVGHIRAFTAFAAASTAMVLGHGVHLSVPVWIVLRLITGIANTGLFMVIESWLNECAEPRARGRVFSMYMIMTYLGITLGQKMLNLGDIQDQTLFLAVGVFMVMSIVPVAMTRGIHPKLPERKGICLTAVCRRAPIGITGCFVSGLLLSGFYAMAPVFTLDIGMDVKQVSWFMALSVLGGLFFQWPVGALSDRLDRTLMLPGIGLVVAGLSLFMAFACRGNIESVLCATTLFGIIFTIYPVSVARAHDMFDASDVVRVSSALLLSYGIGASLGPMAASWVITLSGTPFGLYYYFAGGSLAFAVLALAWRGLEVAEIVPPEEQTDFVMTKRTSNVAIHLDPRVAPEDHDIDTSDETQTVTETRHSLFSA